MRIQTIFITPTEVKDFFEYIQLFVESYQVDFDFDKLKKSKFDRHHLGENWFRYNI